MKYECHGCGKVYDDEEGMPIRCCGKILRHLLEGEEKPCPHCGK